MMDREKVISKLQILRTWCAVNPDYDTGLSAEDCVKAVGWLDDAIAMLCGRKEGEVEMTREAAIKGLWEVADWHYGKYEQTHEEDYLNDGDFLTAVANLLKAQEPVDAVPVVRCRDCKHRDPEDKKCDYGGMAVQGLFFPRPDNWFCADGERRDES